MNHTARILRAILMASLFVPFGALKAGEPHPPEDAGKKKDSKPAYFPIRPGARWVYQDHQKREHRYRILRTLEGGKVQVVIGQIIPSGGSGHLALAMKTLDPKTFLFGMNVPKVNGARTGDAWRGMWSDAFQQRFEIAGFETISFGARKSMKCLKVVESRAWPKSASVKPAEAIHWFAKNVGLVRTLFRRGEKTLPTREIQSFSIPEKPAPWKPPAPPAAGQGLKNAAEARAVVLAKLLDRGILASEKGCAVFQFKKLLTAEDEVRGSGIEKEMQDRIPGPSWFFFIDLHPKAGYAHGVEFWWVDRATGSIRIAKRSWWPEVNGISVYGKERKDHWRPCEFGLFPGKG
ncbi:MAG: hypothetical protein ACYTHM_11275 [Planctomycetota bacterium]|jgi:hypothetical protein